MWTRHDDHVTRDGDDRRATDVDDYDARTTEDARRTEVEDYDEHRPRLVWSPAQLIGLIIGLGFVILGIAVLAQTGFDTNDVHEPHEFVWRLSHTPGVQASSTRPRFPQLRELG